MLKIIKSLIKSKAEREQALAEYLRAGTALGLLAAGAGLYLVLDDWRRQRRTDAADDARAEEREREIDELADQIGAIGELLLKLKLVSAEDVAEHGTLGALATALRSINPVDLEQLTEEIRKIRGSKS
jgi:hypothetical protein